MFRSAGRDAQRYRAHYPDAVDNPRLTDNIRFFRNEIGCYPARETIDEVHRRWRGDHAHLEASHSFIQWLFPIQEAGVNPAAQVLQKHEIATLREDPQAILRLKRSFDMMLDFYGFGFADVGYTLPIVTLVHPERQFRNLYWNGHNYLRITRILKCLGEFGLEDYKVAWLDALHREIYVTKRLAACQSSFEQYWVHTVYDDGRRAALINRIPKPPPKPSCWERLCACFK